MIGELADGFGTRPIDWLWKGRLALGMLSILDGDPGNGKSTIVSDFTARITTGRAWPDGSPCPKGGVVIVGAEDSIEQVLVPRLVAAGADRSRILLVGNIKEPGQAPRLPSLPEDVGLLEAAIRRMDARALFFDPIMPYIGKALNANNDKDVRQALTPLAEMLDRNRCLGLMLRHLSKNDKVSTALYRGLSSIAFVAMARTGMIVAKSPDNAEEFVMAMTKNNIAKWPSSLVYSIEDVELDGGVDTSRIVWGGTTNHSANALTTAFGEDRPRKEAAEDAMRKLLANGPMESQTLWDRCEGEGVKWATYRRARTDLDIKSRQVGARWFSALPDHAHRLDQMLIEHQVSDPPVLTLLNEHLNTKDEHQVEHLVAVGAPNGGPDAHWRHTQDYCPKHLVSLDAVGRCPRC
jgi:putative DNA primase/helicase